MYPNRFKKGNAPIPHKKDCLCFRCSKIPWNKNISTRNIIGEKISISLKSNNRRYGKYKNKNITYSGIHKWVSNKLPNKGICKRCNKKEKTDLSNNNNIGRYNFESWVSRIGEGVRDFEHWEWLCKSCHGKKDQWGDLTKARLILKNKYYR